jgi:hypothetical protein
MPFPPPSGGETNPKSEDQRPKEGRSPNPEAA